MNLVLTRTSTGPEGTLGKLSIDGSFFGFTLELPEPVGNENKQESILRGARICIPKGNYFVQVTFSDRMQKRLPLIYNSKDSMTIVSPIGTWAGVRFHGGNTYLDSLACILVARHEYMNTPSGFKDKLNHLITTWIQGSLSDVLSEKLDNGVVHNLIIN